MSGTVLFPETGFARSDAVAYYRAIAKTLLPHIRNRPLSFKRYPSTINGESFWEKDAPSFTPAWVKRVAVPRRGGEADIEYVVANDMRTLVWIAGAGGVELHPFLHRATALDRPLEVVFDLDPGSGATILDACRVAVILRDALAAIRLESFAKVSGSKGVQVYVPLHTPATHEDTEAFARLVAGELARSHPSLITSKMSKSVRAGKVFIDWSQNADYKTTVAVYSLRSKSAIPYVSMPLEWREIERARKPENLFFTPQQALRRVETRGDLWAPMRTLKQQLPQAGKRAAKSPAAKKKAGPASRLPKPGSQSGRRLFVLAKTESGNELWLDMHGRFKRWILRADREGGERLIALPAGDFRINDEYYRGEVPKEWQSRVILEDSGAYEVIQGSYQQRRFEVFFSGRVLTGMWLLEKVGDDKRHRSWRLQPQAVRE
ncbi:MAG TPA: non-homologous end-joining DNA ligase [Thermoanaerobaculia bacterium]|nr:non-homologous end-joining DNA ligase [Thermoanaerobaculia bacterium]